ncbi:hypothetical protein J5N97_011815 [Dioscorea zingiberensis]|uniref:Receptor-like serine/threonine-protein kinase n=1 Tax=Dioscorea zingiberensis TaxID=325984 RepID=A0A9D5D3S1_9LILI|nr:hypothetical protein J5N97_011815 [Dioscorea zingiberensis]
MRKGSTMKQLLTHVFLFTLFHHSFATDTLKPNEYLLDGKTLVSAKGTFALGFFSPGDSKNRYVGIWYNKLPVQTVVWVANRLSPIAATNGTLQLNGQGVLTINSKIVFQGPSEIRLNNPVAQLLDDGNLVVKEANSSEFAWQSFDYPTDTLLPGMKLGWDLRTGLNRNLTAWQSDNDPSPGSYVASIDLKGIPQLTVWSGSAKRWSSGPWNGTAFSNIPKMSSLNGFLFNFISNEDEVYYMYNTTDPKIVSRLMMNQSGTLERFVWIDSAGKWNVFWYAPNGQCEEYSPCGPFGLCDLKGSPICSCLQGFTPKSPQDWALMDSSSGCVRRTALDCKNKTDGFMILDHAALPDTSNAIVDTNLSLNECRTTCLTNCSCTGYTSADIRGGGSGCIIWVDELIDSGTIPNVVQDLYVRLAAADVASVTDDDELELPQLQWNTVMAATENFAINNILGEGGFGPVYKGKLTEGQEIAVKRLSRNSAQGVDEFKNEVILIAKLQHRNLVRLLGYCIQGVERMLVYEYMSKGSLDALLFVKEQGVHLDWQARLRIIVGIARGLLYLHQDSRFRIIHRDLKASNILLDAEMNPKISDFGMARIFGEDETINKTRKVVGTYGYMAPEYALNGIFSVKSDVFSFGVLVLEIISGQRNKGVYLSEPHLYLLGNAWSLWNEGKALELLDPLIANSFSEVQVLRSINIGLLCVQGIPEDRPIMSSVVLMLCNDDTPLQEPKPPGFIATLPSELTSQPNQADSYTPDNATFTEEIGR